MSSHPTARSVRLAAPAAAGALALSLALVPQPAAAQDHVDRDRQPVHDFATGEQVPRAWSVLWRIDDDHGGEDLIASRVRTWATPRHALTLWYVVFNDPGDCSDGVCGEDDIFVDGVMANGPDLDAIEEAEVSVVSAGRGRVVRRSGRVVLRGGLLEDEVPVGMNRIVIGHPDDGALIPSPVTGITDVEDSEVHLVIQDHGLAHRNRALRRQQLTQFEGACNPDCADIQFAVHLPEEDDD